MKRALAFTLMVLAIMVIAVSCEEPQAPHEHTYAPEWSHDDTFHWHASACGHEDQVSDKAPHTWKEGGDENGWIVDVASTEKEEGKKHRECSVCGYKEERKVPVQGHVHTYSAYDCNGSKHWRTCTSCGEKFTYTHTFRYASVDGTNHCQKCYCGYSENEEKHVYTSGAQKVSGTTVYDVCDLCGYLNAITKDDTDTGVVTAGNQIKIEATETVNGKTVVKGNVDIQVAVTASETTDSNETIVTFNKGALKVDENASTVSLIVKAAPITTASSADYKQNLNKESKGEATGADVVISATQAVVAGFEFKLEGADGSDLTGTELESGSDTKKKGTEIKTYIAKGLGDKDNLKIVYVGSSVKETDDNKAVINEYENGSGYLRFTVYHFSKYAIISNTAVAKDNKGNIYSVDDEKKTESAVLKTALEGVGKGEITTITLMKDLNLSKITNWTPLFEGTRDEASYTADGTGFKGTFDGNGHTISNLKIDTSDTNTYKNNNSASSVNMTAEKYCIGLFGVLDGGTIKNLTLANLNISATGSETVGALVGLMVNGATVENITLESGKISTKETGGIIGRANISGTISNCRNKATITSTDGGTGGIVGKVNYSELGKEVSIINCANEGTISATKDGAGYVGGIAGMLAGNAENCTNTGSVSGKGDGIGGIVGEQNRYGYIKNSENSGAISGNHSGSGGDADAVVGGIVGWVRYENSAKNYPKTEVIEISDNTNTGNVTLQNGISAGGIVGLLHHVGVVRNNTNSAELITGGTFAAGIVGEYQNNEQTDPYYGKKGYTETAITGNTSKTESGKIAVASGTCRTDIVWNNSSGKIKVLNNSPSTDDVVCSVADSGGEITYYQTVSEAEEKFEEGNSLTLLDCSHSNEVSDEKASKWTVVHKNCNKVKNSWHVKNTEDFSGGYGTKIEPYIIGTKEQFQNITEMYEKYAYYKLSDDYSETELTGWTPVTLHGSFNGNKKSLTNITACLFNIVGYQLVKEDILLENFDATLNISSLGTNVTGSLIKNVFNSGTTTFENINVHGKIDGFWNIGSFYNYGTANYNGKGASYTAIFKNCKSDATLICTTGNNGGGFVGHGYEGDGNALTLSFDSNSEYTGKFYTTKGNGKKYIAMWSSWTNAEDKIAVKNTEYSGSNWDADWNKYSSDNNIKIPEVIPTSDETGYKVAIDKDVSYVIVSVSAQLTAYDENGCEIPNLKGITLALGNEKKEEVSGSVNVLDKVTSAQIDNNAGNYGYEIDNSVMTVCVPGNFNYQSGTVRLTVAQYNTNGEIVAAGTVNLCAISKK